MQLILISMQVAVSTMSKYFSQTLYGYYMFSYFSKHGRRVAKNLLGSQLSKVEVKIGSIMHQREIIELGYFYPSDPINDVNIENDFTLHWIFSFPQDLFVQHRLRNHAFLPLTKEIEILSIKKNQFIFFLFYKKSCIPAPPVENENPLYQGNSVLFFHFCKDNRRVGCMGNQNNFPLYQRLPSPHNCTLGSDSQK